MNNDDMMKIRLSYEQGYAYEDVDINVILQSYFSMNIKVYKKINNIISLWNKCNSENSFSEEESEYLEEKLFEDIRSLLTDLIEELRNLDDKESIKDYHYSYYRIVLLLINFLEKEKGRSLNYILSNDEAEADDSKVEGDDSEAEDDDSEVEGGDSEEKNNIHKIEDSLISLKRTGILGGILLEDIYAFRHASGNIKSGRTYITFKVSLYKENYVVLIAIAPIFLNQIKSWDKLYMNLKEDFISRLDMTN